MQVNFYLYIRMIASCNYCSLLSFSIFSYLLSDCPFSLNAGPQSTHWFRNLLMGQAWTTLELVFICYESQSLQNVLMIKHLPKGWAVLCSLLRHFSPLWVATGSFSNTVLTTINNCLALHRLPSVFQIDCLKLTLG